MTAATTPVGAPSSPQPLHDLLMTASVIATLLVANQALHHYLNGLGSPTVLFAGLWGALALSVAYEMRRASTRRGKMIGLLATAIHFTIGLLLAGGIRYELLSLIESFKEVAAKNSDVIEIVGPDVMAALSNRVIGYGGSFGLGMSISRLALDKILRKAIYAVFTRPNNRPSPCPCCGNVTS